jgi:hypothetical protein
MLNIESDQIQLLIGGGEGTIGQCRFEDFNVACVGFFEEMRLAF